MLSDTASLAPSKSAFYANGRQSPAPSLPKGNFDRYMQRGPGGSAGTQDEFELSRFDTAYSTDQQPLLGYGQRPPIDRSVSSLPQYPGQSASTVHLPMDGYREAPLHRPSPISRDPSYGNQTPPSQYQGYNSPSEDMNMAGRGAFHNR